MSDASYTLTFEDEEPEAINLAAFLQANADLDAETKATISALQPGESYEEGGGASPVWRITRTA
jgi:hypothetical protein